MRIDRQHFGNTVSGDPVSLFTLRADCGFAVQLTDWGATIASIQVPDRLGRLDDVVLGYDQLKDYETNPFFFGSTVGRFCNRIAGARFELDGQEVVLASNDGPHHLHGGSSGFSHRLWRSVIERDRAVRMILLSPHGDQGYPGNLAVEVLFELMPDRGLKISCSARSDRDTIVNLTNHTYFNLRGAGCGDVRHHRVGIDADAWLPVDHEWLPTGEINPVQDTGMDFRNGRPVGAAGFNHYFLLNGSGGLRKAARLFDPESGRRLEVLTDQPGVQFYTGDYLNEPAGRGGAPYGPCAGLCLETQGAPDAPNQPHFPSTVLRGGQRFETTTIFRFPEAKECHEHV